MSSIERVHLFKSTNNVNNTKSKRRIKLTQTHFQAQDLLLRIYYIYLFQCISERNKLKTSQNTMIARHAQHQKLAEIKDETHRLNWCSLFVVFRWCSIQRIRLWFFKSLYLPLGRNENTLTQTILGFVVVVVVYIIFRCCSHSFRLFCYWWHIKRVVARISVAHRSISSARRNSGLKVEFVLPATSSIKLML